MTQQAKAKFRCTEVRSTEAGASVTLQPVTNNNADNSKFYKHTPAGKIELSIVNPALDGFFRPSTEYEVTFAIPVPEKTAEPAQAGGHLGYGSFQYCPGGRGGHGVTNADIPQGGCPGGSGHMDTGRDNHQP